MGGVTDSTGRLEVCVNGVWGRVCNFFGYWGPDNARVVCRQLGFSDKSKISSIMPTLSPFVSPDAYILEHDPQRYGASGRVAVVGEVHCVGTEPELLECSHASIGSHLCKGISRSDPDIIVSCLGIHMYRQSFNGV